MIDVEVGDVVAVRFLDHTSTCDCNDSEPPEFVVYGAVSAVHDTHIHVKSWANLDIDEAHNTEGYLILNAVILGIQYLLPCDEVWHWEDDDETE